MTLVPLIGCYLAATMTHRNFKKTFWCSLSFKCQWSIANTVYQLSTYRPFQYCQCGQVILLQLSVDVEGPLLTFTVCREFSTDSVFSCMESLPPRIHGLARELDIFDSWIRVSAETPLTNPSTSNMSFIFEIQRVESRQ